MRRVLVTGSGQNSLISRIDTNFPGIFEPGMRVTSRDVTHGKPHPEPFIRAMQLARVSPSQSIVIENAPLGIEAGDRAGAFTIGVTTGPIPVEEMGALARPWYSPRWRPLPKLSRYCSTLCCTPA